MGGQYGIDELKDVLDFGLEFLPAVKKAKEDGALTWSDALHLGPVIMKAPGAFIGIGDVPKELNERCIGMGLTGI